MKKNLWHYPRKDLAKKYMDLLDTGITHRITLFAPRRKGKTHFLVYDLAEEAEKRKRFVIYISMWDNPDAPQRQIITALQQGLQLLTTRRQPIKRLLASTIKKLKIEGVTGIGKLGTEIEFAEDPVSANVDELSNISVLFKKLYELASRRKVLLLIDEVQHLSTSKSFDSLIHNMRTSLDIYADRIEAVFTGSSRTGLSKLFSDSKAPLYAFGDVMEFPNLDKGFVEYLGGVYKTVTKKSLDVKKAWQLFRKLDYSPYYMRMLLQAMIIQASDDINNIYKEVKENIAMQFGYKKKWENMKKLDRAVYIAIIDNKKIYTATQIKQFTKQTKEKATTAKIQKSLERLIDLQMVSMGQRGEYYIGNPGFKDWCVDQQK